MKMPANLQVLVADDERDVLEMVSKNLTNAGFVVTKAEDGAEALEKARSLGPALMVLDLMLPQMTGIEVLRALRANERTVHLPVIILTARKDEIDRVIAFELGADDYVTKPFSPRELTLRVKRILSRNGMAADPPVLTTRGIRLDRERHELLVEGRRVQVTAMEFRLLSVLMQGAGKVLSREELSTRVWGPAADIESRTIDTHLRRLRQKLAPLQNCIQTVRGFGYRVAE
jgi:two-component system phosphate regulon response regulator PhoB